MGCDDKWAKDLDDEEVDRNKGLAPVMLNEEEKYLRFSRVPTKSYTLRKKFISQKYNFDKKEESKREKSKGCCIDKIERKIKLRENKKNKENEKKLSKEKDDLKNIECKKVKRKTKSTVLGGRCRFKNLNNITPHFKYKLNRVLKFISEQVLVDQPNHFNTYIAEKLEERVEVRAYMEAAFQGDESEEDEDNRCVCVNCGKLKLVKSEVEVDKGAKEPKECTCMKEVIRNMEPKCTACRNREPEDPTCDVEVDVKDMLKKEKDEVNRFSYLDKADKISIDSVAEICTLDGIDELDIDEKPYEFEKEGVRGVSGKKDETEDVLLTQMDDILDDVVDDNTENILKSASQVDNTPELSLSSGKEMSGEDNSQKFESVLEKQESDLEIEEEILEMDGKKSGESNFENIEEDNGGMVSEKDVVDNETEKKDVEFENEARFEEVDKIEEVGEVDEEEQEVKSETEKISHIEREMTSHTETEKISQVEKEMISHNELENISHIEKEMTSNTETEKISQLEQINQEVEEETTESNYENTINKDADNFHSLKEDDMSKESQRATEYTEEDSDERKMDDYDGDDDDDSDSHFGD